MLSLVPCNKMSKNINRSTLEEFWLPNFNCELFQTKHLSMDAWCWRPPFPTLFLALHDSCFTLHCPTLHTNSTTPFHFYQQLISTPTHLAHCLSNQSESKTAELQVIDASAIKQRLTHHMLKTMDGNECYN